MSGWTTIFPQGLRWKIQCSQGCPPWDFQPMRFNRT